MHFKCTCIAEHIDVSYVSYADFLDGLLIPLPLKYELNLGTLKDSRKCIHQKQGYAVLVQISSESPILAH